jgi:hypothetical protein
MFSPANSALLQAAKHGHLITWPCLNEQAINTHLKLMPVTATGNMNQCRQHIRPTSKNSITSDMEDEAVTPLVWEPKLILFMQLWSTKDNYIYISHQEISDKIQQRQLVCHGVLRL